ncbi:MAG: hypothetical protein ACRERE_41775 [Candidatus Entotheonellia bacterium]
METSDTGSAKATVYLETRLVSYLTARPSRDGLVAAHQHLTAAWWDQQRPRYALFTSQVVLAEAGAGDPETAQRRLTALEPLPLLALRMRRLRSPRRSSPDRRCQRKPPKRHSTSPWPASTGWRSS